MRIFLVILFYGFASIDFLSAQTWTQASSPAGGWTSFVVSADGSKLLASGVDGNLYTSTNTGGTWTLQADAINATNDWNCLDSSADGSNLLAEDNDTGDLYASTNAGVLWFQLINAPTGISSLAASANGATLATIASGTIYLSTNSGDTWEEPTNPPAVPSGDADNSVIEQFRSLAASADGTKMELSAGLFSPGIAIPGADNSLIRFFSGVFTSTNSGASWQLSNDSLEYNLNSIASSADGSNILMCGPAYYNFSVRYVLQAGQYWFYPVFYGNPLWHSANAGGSWSGVWNDPTPPAPVLSNGNSLPNPNPYNYHAAYLEVDRVASDASGGNCVALDNPDDLVYLSTNSGANWSQLASTPAGTGASQIAISADGNEITLGSSNGNIYTSQMTSSPFLNLATANGNLAFSWTIPSTNLVLQESSSLGTGNWVTLTNPLNLIFSNLQYQTSLSPTNSQGFFRLATP